MFDIPVKIEGIEKRRRSVGLFHILAGFFLAANASLIFKYLVYNYFWTLLPVYVLAIASVAYGIFRKRIDISYKYNRSLRFIQSLTFLMLALYELRSESTIRSISLFLWAGICLTLLFIERFIHREPLVKINSDGVFAPDGISGKSTMWDAIESVVLRQDFITLNFRNNRYLQYEISNMLTGTEIERINLFCSEQLVKAQSQRAESKEEQD